MDTVSDILSWWHWFRLWSCWHAPCRYPLREPWKVTWILSEYIRYIYILIVLFTGSLNSFPVLNCSIWGNNIPIILAGLEINEARPHDKLPYRGAWLWVGSEMIHLMELPNPDPLNGRPEHGGRDRHACVQIRHVSKLKDILDRAGRYLCLLIVWRIELLKKNFTLPHWHGQASKLSLILSMQNGRYTIHPQSIWKAGYLL